MAKVVNSSCEEDVDSEIASGFDEFIASSDSALTLMKMPCWMRVMNLMIGAARVTVSLMKIDLNLTIHPW